MSQFATINDALNAYTTMMIEAESGHRARVISLDGLMLAGRQIIEIAGIPPYLGPDDLDDWSGYNLTQSGWYAFIRILARPGTKVSNNTKIEGASGYIATNGNDYVDVAVRFDVAAQSQEIKVTWDNYIDIFIIKATDLAVRNLDYRTTFYVYDLSPYVTWQYALTSDETFVEGKNYYTLEGDKYQLAAVTAGESIPADTYYNHSKLHIEGAVRNITYRLDEVIDCPSEIVLPEIEDDTHGCWFEFQLRHNGSYSMTLLPPEGVKVATEHTQAESAGMNMIDLHYLNVDGVKLWRFMNTHSTIPS